MQPIRIKMSPRAGCLAKLPALDLQSVLEKAYETVFGRDSVHPMQQPEDCFSMDVEEGRLLISTDFGPLVGTHVAEAGRIAALHAMSDIYASGGIPKCAATILILSEEDSHSHPNFAEQLITGLVQTCREETVEVQTGHTVMGSETMIGLTVIGTPRNGVILRKTGG